MYNPNDPYYQAMLQQAARAAQGGHVSGLDFVGAMAPAYPYSPHVAGYDFVGAEMAKAAMMGAPMYRPGPMPYAQGVAIPPPGVYSTDNSPRTPRRKPAGFPLAIIPIGQTAVIATMLPTEALRPERIVIVDATGQGLTDVLVDDIKVGSQSQNIGQGPMSADVFNSAAFDTIFEGNTLNLGVSLSVSIRLTAAALGQRVFAITVLGRSAQG